MCENVAPMKILNCIRQNCQPILYESLVNDSSKFGGFLAGSVELKYNIFNILSEKSQLN